MESCLSQKLIISSKGSGDVSKPIFIISKADDMVHKDIAKRNIEEEDGAKKEIISMSKNRLI